MKVDFLVYMGNLGSSMWIITGRGYNNTDYMDKSF